ncbi:MAG: methyl-accepting chemotaxis protein [Dehalococcoidia bacterium]
MKLSVRAKLLTGFGVVLVLLAMVSAFAIIRLNEAAGRTSSLYRENTLGVRYALEANFNMAASGRDEKRAFLAPMGDQRTKMIEDARAELRAAEQSARDYETTYASPTDREQWEKVVAGMNRVIGPRRTVLEQLAVGDDVAANQTARGMSADITAMNAALDEAAQFNEELASDSAATAQASAVSSRFFVVGASLAAIVVGLGAGMWLSRDLAAAIDKVRVAAAGIAKGDLDQDVSIDRGDEIGALAHAVDEMIAYLQATAEAAARIADGDLTVEVRPQSDRDVLGNAFSTMVTRLNTAIRETAHTASELGQAKDHLAASAEQAAQATQEVARSSQQVASGTSQQASAAQGVSAGVGDLTEVIGQIVAGAQAQASSVDAANELGLKVAAAASQIAASASTASEGARAATATAGEGAAMVRRIVTGMQQIKRTVDAAAGQVSNLGERSQEIGRIVSVIEDIAAQTNLLALNAAIEAARAGEQGRGFAVVADEVRQLAERVAGATREIADLIGGVQTGVAASVDAMHEGTAEVGAGTAAATEAGVALDEILSAADSVNSQVAQIADGALELQQAGQEMATLLEQIREVVEQNTESTRQMQGTASRASVAVGEIASVAEENSAATEQLSASAEEMSAQVEELTASAHQLGQMADRLNDQVGQFRISEQPSAAVSAKVSPIRRAA